MINKLRKQIFWSIELSTLGVLLIILIIFNTINYMQNDHEEWEMMNSYMQRLDASSDGDADDVPAQDESSAQSGAEVSAQSEIGETIYQNGVSTSLSQNGAGSGPQGSGSGVQARNGELRGKKGNELMKAIYSGELTVIEETDGAAPEAIFGFAQDYDGEKLKKLVEDIEAKDSDSGTISGMKYMIKKSGTDTYIELLDSGYMGTELLRNVLVSLAGMAAAGLVFALLAHQLAKRISRPVEETIKNQKQFIADASHELKTPVTVINANIGILEKEIGENRWLGFIKEEGGRMTALIGSLLQLSRLDYEEESGKQEHDKGNFDLNEALMEIALPFESVAFENNIDFEMDIQDAAPVFGSCGEIKQIAGILIDNAIKNAGSGGKVSITAQEGMRRGKRKEEKTVRICVANTGKEIPEKDLPYIFNRFYKTDSSRLYQAGSFGLGLAIAKSLAEKNEADLSVVSGSGKTVFTLEMKAGA